MAGHLADKPHSVSLTQRVGVQAFMARETDVSSGGLSGERRDTLEPKFHIIACVGHSGVIPVSDNPAVPGDERFWIRVSCY